MVNTYQVNLRIRDENFSQTLQRVKFEMNQLNMATIAYQTTMNALRIGSIAGIASMAAMVAPTVLATKVLADYDTTLRRAVTLGGADYMTNMESLNERILEIASSWGIASEEIVAGVVDFAKAGFEYADTMEMIEGTAQLALMNQEDFSVAAETVTYAFQLWGDEVGDINDMMESMHVAANMTIMDVGDLGSAFEYAGSSFKIAGITFDEFLAAFGALSQVAYTSGQTVGTLINRLLVHGDKLEDALGLAPGTIVSDGKVNLKELIDILVNFDDKYVATTEVAQLFGVRSVAAFNAMMASADDYVEVLAVLNQNTNTLYEDSLYMASSLGSLMQQLKESLFVELKSPVVLESLRAAIASLKTAISEGGLGLMLADLVKMSIIFVSENGPQLIQTILKLMNTMMKFAPTIENVAITFGRVLEFIAKIPAPLLMMIGMFVMLNQVIPMRNLMIFATSFRMQIHKVASEALYAQTTIKGMGQSIQYTYLQSNGAMPYLGRFMLRTKLMKSEALAAQLSIRGLGKAFVSTGMASQMAASMGLMAVMTAFTAIMTSKDGVVLALGAITAALSAVALAAWLAGEGFAMISFGASAAAAMAAVGAMWVAMDKQNKQMQAELDNLENEFGSARGGTVLSTGWRYIHEGEVIVPNMAQVDSKQQVVGGGDTYNYDYRVVNIYDVERVDLEEELRARGK